MFRVEPTSIIEFKQVASGIILLEKPLVFKFINVTTTFVSWIDEKIINIGYVLFDANILLENCRLYPFYLLAKTSSGSIDSIEIEKSNFYFSCKSLTSSNTLIICDWLLGCIGFILKQAVKKDPSFIYRTIAKSIKI